MKKSEWISIRDLTEFTNADGELPTIDFSWVPERWWCWICPHQRRNVPLEKIHRRHFEACVFSQIWLELKSEGCPRIRNFSESPARLGKEI
ncbi:hypothetical protein PDQ79_34070 [Bacillus cereus]|nr:hypothetical protein [Bacillus cereus]